MFFKLRQWKKKSLKITFTKHPQSQRKLMEYRHVKACLPKQILTSTVYAFLFKDIKLYLGISLLVISKFLIYKETRKVTKFPTPNYHWLTVTVDFIPMHMYDWWMHCTWVYMSVPVHVTNRVFFNTHKHVWKVGFFWQIIL